MNKPAATQPRKIPLYDINLVAFLRFHNIPVELRKASGRVVFEIPATDEVYRLMDLYQGNPLVNVLDFVSAIRELRSRMIAVRDPKQDPTGQGSY